MTHAEFELLPAPVAMWLERLYIAADGGTLPSGIEWVAANGTTADVITLHTEHNVWWLGAVVCRLVRWENCAKPVLVAGGIFSTKV